MRRCIRSQIGFKQALAYDFDSFAPKVEKINPIATSFSVLEIMVLRTLLTGYPNTHQGFLST